ncbi:MAG: YdcF family protein [Acidobacteriota bacterium]
MKRVLLAVLVLGLLIAAWFAVAPSLATYLMIERPLVHADAMIVLSGSSVYNERAFRAAELYKQGVSPKIFLTNDGVRAGWSESQKTNPRYVDLAQWDLISLGVPADAITILPGEVSGTESEALVLATEIKQRPLSSVLIVTSAYHSRRALWTFEKAFAGKGVTLGIEHAPLGDLNPKPSNWWHNRLGWKLVGAEYFKAVGYWLFY